jgi:hypothetical protein
MSATFDTLEYTKGAEAVGFKRDQAEYQAGQMAKLIDNQLVTKSLLVNEVNSIKKHITSVEQTIIILEQKLIIKLGSIMIAGIGILGFILKH